MITSFLPEGPVRRTVLPSRAAALLTLVLLSGCGPTPAADGGAPGTAAAGDVPGGDADAFGGGVPPADAPDGSDPGTPDEAESPAAACPARDAARHLPDLAGRRFDPHGADLRCLVHLSALTPDGRDVAHDAAAAARWTVASSQPAAGTAVHGDTPVVLHLRPVRTTTATPRRTPTPPHSSVRKEAPRHPAAPRRTRRR
ncbi:hypothetical protein LO771_21315 [Streptacidiphilus sp. ASG 303]|uniref:hypothetical protein n=1 Tax=Streptacidiphilus sp. ASG 303 TaxID=2896847 RepID=UPI001E38E10D|nr:hypothetical protein [Streptacidiphilus sp. ASG 303]MCD0484860.1 hypothetical protein [Streptacidiphilus sp. ASG 303]